ncbi:MAG: class I SAM-dependent methyltransferase, partial [Bacteroidia bacterium]|nr:class I SAM-dependent methyltransferase [Bacteroidia bacterium]
MTACIICNNCNNTSNNQPVVVMELQLGLKEEFTYQLCNNCGSMQLLNPPSDLSSYYPNENYYSFNMKLRSLKKPDFLSLIKASYLLYGKNAIPGRLLSIGYKIPEFYEWMINTRVQLNDAILDVGCGNGGLLSRLYQMGFTNLTGIDPFIDMDHDHGTIKIFKKDLNDLQQKFDLIMMHHSLEHMFDPLTVLKKTWSLLNENSYLLLRIPIMGNYGWQKYGTYWCGLDAPRHIFIPSERGIRLLIKQAGFQIENIEYDSNDSYIWSSEQYLKGIPLTADNSRMNNKKKSIFSKEQVREFKKIIFTENHRKNGDT